MRINYIIACYFGTRRFYNKNYIEDNFYYVKKHLKFLKNFKDKNIQQITFVINGNIENLQIFQDLLSSFCDIDYEIINRPNIDYSYGAWEEAIIKNLNKFDYFMLMEDDYAPAIENFTEYFLNFFNSENVAAVVSLFDTLQQNKKHAAISNGLICNNNIDKIYKKYGKVFLLNNKQNNYASAEYNQVHYLDFFINEGYIINDISSISRNNFLEINGSIKACSKLDGLEIINPII